MKKRELRAKITEMQIEINRLEIELVAANYRASFPPPAPLPMPIAPQPPWTPEPWRKWADPNPNWPTTTPDTIGPPYIVT